MITPSSRQSVPCLKLQRHGNSILAGDTHAPLYCATSSPRTKTLLFDSSSSARASLRASLTATSFTPLGVAYVLLFECVGIEATGRSEEREIIERGRVQELKREAGRRIRDATIVRGKPGSRQEVCRSWDDGVFSIFECWEIGNCIHLEIHRAVLAPGLTGRGRPHQLLSLIFILQVP